MAVALKVAVRLLVLPVKLVIEGIASPDLDVTVMGMIFVAVWPSASVMVSVALNVPVEL